MKFDEIIGKLSRDEVVEIAGGEVIITKKLREYIGDIPIYNIFVMFPRDGREPVEFNDFDELADFSYFNEHGVSIRRCIVCGNLPQGGYYIDHEANHEYCCFGHIVTWMNEVFGEGNWKTRDGGLEGMKFMVKIKESEASDYEKTVKDGEDWWREYPIEWVAPYEFCSNFPAEGVQFVEDLCEHKAD